MDYRSSKYHMPFAQHLDRDDYENFLHAHTQHCISIDFDNRAKYAYFNIKKVTKLNVGNFHVKFKNGEEYIYTNNSSFYKVT